MNSTHYSKIAMSCS